MKASPRTFGVRPQGVDLGIPHSGVPDRPEVKIELAVPLDCSPLGNRLAEQVDDVPDISAEGPREFVDYDVA